MAVAVAVVLGCAAAASAEPPDPTTTTLAPTTTTVPPTTTTTLVDPEPTPEQLEHDQALELVVMLGSFAAGAVTGRSLWWA